MHSRSVAASSTIAVILVIACGAPPAAPPTTALPPVSPPVAVPSPPPMHVVADPPADLCASPLATWLAPALLPATCGAYDVTITYRRVGVGGHDFVAMFVLDTHEAGYDGPIHRRRVLTVDGRAIGDGWIENDFDAYALPTPTRDDEALALLALVEWGGEPAPLIDAAAVLAFAEREADLASTLSARPVGLAREGDAVLLRAWSVTLPEGVHRMHPRVTEGHADYLVVRMENGRIRSTSERVRVGTLRGSETHWHAPAPPDPNDPLAGVP